MKGYYQMILGSMDDAHRLASVAWAPNMAKIAGARWPVLIDSLLSSDPHVVLIKSGMLPCAPRPSRSDSHALESANLFISCFMEFARKGIHLADHYWKVSKRMLLFMCRSPTSRFAEGIDICLASAEESLTLDILVLSIPGIPPKRTQGSRYTERPF